MTTAADPDPGPWSLARAFAFWLIMLASLALAKGMCMLQRRVPTRFLRVKDRPLPYED